MIELRLFISGGRARAALARHRFELLCERIGTDDLVVEVVDVRERPDLAEEIKVVATPLLVRMKPEPLRRIIGDLDDIELVLGLLDLPLATTTDRTTDE